LKITNDDRFDYYPKHEISTKNDFALFVVFVVVLSVVVVVAFVVIVLLMSLL